MSKGMVVKLIAGEYTVYDKVNNQSFITKPRGLFRLNDNSIKVGDNVEYTKMGDSMIITELLPRSNDLERPSIANIDQAFVVFSVKEPVLNLNLLDRFLAILEYSNIQTYIVFNKWDLLDDNNLIEVEKIKEYYEEIGYNVITTSAKNKLTDQLSSLIKDKISVITGQSGVGKSSLLNVIDPNLNIETNEISKALNRGKHTTRHTQLININGGWIADTPGFGIMDFEKMTEADLTHSFREFFLNSSLCKFKGCLHLNEPNCQIKTLVKSGKIMQSRYDNYLSFIEEIKKRKKW